MSEELRSRRGRRLTVIGDPALLTMERMDEFSARIDSDPRIASLSLVSGPARPPTWLRATTASGPLVAIATPATRVNTPMDTNPACQPTNSAATPATRRPPNPPMIEPMPNTPARRMPSGPSASSPI